jgi:hypothetical protein
MTLQAERELTRAQHQAHRRKRRGLRRGGRYLLTALVAVVAVTVLCAAVSVVGGLRTPGNENFKAKWADWLRSHHASFVVNPLERWYYTEKAPAPGGRPAALNTVPQPEPVPSPPVDASPVQAAPQTAPGHLTPPAAVPLIVLPSLAGEGQWKASGPIINGSPAMYVAQYRADTTYTSQITTAVWIDPTVLHVRLVPGAQEPGGIWTEPPELSGAAAASAVAAFNGGFRFQDARGGFFLDGRAAIPLRPGAASMVIDETGAVNIGQWGTEVVMDPHVHAVLQNLVPLVDNGRMAPNATYTDTRLWGSTLGADTVVARSGIGVTATGALLYVAGPALTARSLAEALQRAGAVRAMALDINPYWVTFNLYDHPDPANPSRIAASKLYPEMTRPATRYLGPTRESRDFFTISIA